VKLVKCRWRTDSICPYPARCRYGYECVARPVETVMAHVNRDISMDDETGAALDDIIAAAVRRLGREDA